jgi:translation initiation factor IF-1
MPATRTDGEPAPVSAQRARLGLFLQLLVVGGFFAAYFIAGDDLPRWTPLLLPLAMFPATVVRNGYRHRRRDRGVDARARIVRRLPGSDRFEIETSDGAHFEASVGVRATFLRRTRIEPGAVVEARVWPGTAGARVLRVEPAVVVAPAR